MEAKTVIEAFGGPAELARRLNYGQFGPQRVTNWLARGIPARVQLEHGEMFRRQIRRAKVGASGTAKAA
jgi:hypothetical protein